MNKRVMLGLALIAVSSMGAEYRTQNFVVIATNQQLAQQVGQAAEQYRREKAILWLGKEMPTWPAPCPLRVNVSMDGPSGETEFTFGSGGVTSQRMTIRGPIDRLLYSVLPHEITHTIFAYHFKTPVPRWVDEGGSVLSEDDPERERHDKLARSILNKNQQIPMRTLFSLKEYPPQVMCLYAQGYSMSDYLVKRSNRQHLLSFVSHGMYYGWDKAAKSHFGHENVEELEQAWLKHLRDTKNGQPSTIIAANGNAGNSDKTNASTNTNKNLIATGQKTVRMTAPPAQPVEPQGIARGAMATPDQAGKAQWQPGVRLEAPVPITPVIPRIPSYVPETTTSVQLGMPRP